MSFDTTQWGKTSEIYKESSTKTNMLGTRLALPDGRVYRYAKSGAAIAIGRVCGSAMYVTAHAVAANPTVARTTAQWDAGTYTIQVSTTAVATAGIVSANRFDDGYIWGQNAAGEGQLLQIKSHTAGTTAASTPTFTMYEDDLLTIGITTTSELGIIKNLYDNIVTHTGLVAGGPVVGVAPIAISAASKYFWAQTWGPCPTIRGRIATIRGRAVVVGNTTGGDTGAVVAGSVYPGYSTDAKLSTFGQQPNIGFTLVPSAADADFDLTYLTIAP